MKSFRTLCYFPILFSVLAILTPPSGAGILITRDEHGLKLEEAALISVNGKDKVLNLGLQPKAAVPIGKLPALKLGGTLLKVAIGIPALYSENMVQYLFPEGLGKNGPAEPAAAWNEARLTYKRASNDKNPGSFTVAAFVAFLPGGVDELAELCDDPIGLGFIAGQDKVFVTQMELMATSVKVYGKDPALAPLRNHLEQSMRTRYEQFESGLGSASVLDQALKLAELSQGVYPSDPEQVKLRDLLKARKVWLDRKIAILNAFAAVGEWDSFLLGAQSFETFEPAFPSMADTRVKALKASLESHRKSGDVLQTDSEFEAALEEFRLAGRRQPSDPIVQQKASIAWGEYSREMAMNSRGRKRLGSGESDALNQAVQFATNYKTENKLDLALKSIGEAERIDPDSLPMLLKKAEILGAQQNFSAAFTTLDRYDLHAVDEERERARSLRTDLLFRLTSNVEDLKAKLQAAWASGSYHKVYTLSVNGLRAKNDDADLLFDAGVASVITRDTKLGREYLNRYIEISNTLDANHAQRAEVRRMLASIRASNETEAGEANWMSGKKLPPNVYYCPVSLAFQPRIDRIDAAKMKVSFDWEGDRLMGITPTYDKPEHATGERKISFAYDNKYPQVEVVAEDARAQKLNVAEPDEIVKRSSLVVLNNPYINPDAVQRLKGKDITLGIAGNRFFQPFVWDKVHYFRFKYDIAGRVAQAREITGPDGPPTDLTLRFEWNGQTLSAVHGYQGPDEQHLVKIYDRMIEYSDGKIVSEEIRGQGKSSKITYKYGNGRLISATANDATLDSRTRQVTFR